MFLFRLRYSVLSVSLAALFCVTSESTHAEPRGLTEADRLALEEQLEKIQEQSKDRVSSLYRRAISDYKSAIRSDDATMTLYLKCVEQVEYIDLKKKNQDFREWKRKHSESLSSGSMRMALRHQLSWLLLTLEAAEKEGDYSELGPKAVTHLNQIFENAEKLKDHRKILGRNALSSAFAKAYKLNVKIKDWPGSAIDIANIYDKVVMPPLRTPSRIESLRAAWIKRIFHEKAIVVEWTDTKSTTIGKKDALQTPELEKFIEEKQPQLQWQMELDCFKAGDQQKAAVQMLKILETNINHKDAPKWIAEFQKLVTPPKPKQATE